MTNTLKNIDYSRLPEHMQDSMRLWVERGITRGSFLMAVLSNDLMEALGRADDVNINRLADYARFLYNDAPSGCYGSPAKVRAWSERGGLLGKEPACNAMPQTEEA